MNRLKKRKLILILAGVGGHEAQAVLLKEGLTPYSDFLSVEMILEAASMNQHVGAHQITSSSHLTKQASKFRFLKLLLVLAQNIVQLTKMLQKKKKHFDVALITLGPFPAIPGYVASKLCSINFASIESRSRFQSLSSTNRLLLMLNARVFVQHVSRESSARNLKHLGVLR